MPSYFGETVKENADRVEEASNLLIRLDLRRDCREVINETSSPCQPVPVSFGLYTDVTLGVTKSKQADELMTASNESHTRARPEHLSGEEDSKRTGKQNTKLPKGAIKTRPEPVAFRRRKCRTPYCRTNRRFVWGDNSMDAFISPV